MKIDAIIDWMIDDDELGIKSTDFDKIPVDMDYVEADEASIVEWVENELAKQYGVSLYAGKDFEILNLDGVLHELDDDCEDNDN